MAPIGRHVSQAQRLEEGFGSMSEMGSIVVTDVIAVMSSTVEAFLFVACRQRRSLDKLEMTEAVLEMTEAVLEMTECAMTAGRIRQTR